jgi:hypothetical protein
LAPCHQELPHEPRNPSIGRSTPWQPIHIHSHPIVHAHRSLFLKHPKAAANLAAEQGYRAIGRAGTTIPSSAYTNSVCRNSLSMERAAADVPHGLALRCRTAQHSPKCGDDGWLRSPDGRHGLIILPSAPEALVELHELFPLSDLRYRVLLL